MSDALPEYITLAEAAAHVGIHRQSLRRLVAKGGGPRVTRIGQAHVVARADLLAWAETYQPVGGRPKAGGS